MGKLFSQAQIDKIDAVAKKSAQSLTPSTPPKSKSINNTLKQMSDNVVEYFKDSKAILINTQEDLHNYVLKLIEVGYAGIDCETTGLDRIQDHMVGFSLYYPGGVEAYIPLKHIIPIFEEPYKNQITYEQAHDELMLIVDSETRLIFANADFDLSFFYRDLGVDFNDRCFYDVILAWRCLKENERDNTLKGLYNKYVLKGKGDPKKFSDFFTADLFPYCKPEVAKLYAANDAKITYELFQFQLPYATEDNPKCKKAHLEAIARLIWDVEIPLIKVCQNMHRTGIYLDKDISDTLIVRYEAKLAEAKKTLADMVQEVIEKCDPKVAEKRPFKTGETFNCNSPIHAKYLLYTMMKIPTGRDGQGTGKDVLTDLNLPITNQILKVRGLLVLINTFVKKLPNSVTLDSRIHAQFKQIGADCVTAGTVIPTYSGFTTIDEICSPAVFTPGVHVDVDDVEVINLYNEYEKASSAIYYENFPTVKIETLYGFNISGTHNHPIIVMNDGIKMFMNLSQVKIGDSVFVPTYSDVLNKQCTDEQQYACPNNENIIAVSTSAINEDTAEVMGMLHGLTLFAFCNRYLFSVDDCSNSQLAKVFRSRMSNVWKDWDLWYRDVCSNNLNVANTLAPDYLSSDSIFDNQHTVPDIIWKSPCNVINAYIRGLILFELCNRYTSNTADADNYEKDYPCTIHNLSREDTNFLQTYLAANGILVDNRYSSIVIDAYNFAKLILLVGWFDDADKPTVSDSHYILHRSECSEFEVQGGYALPITSIMYGCENVYDIHVPGTHSFMSNGMISHNTGRMSCIAEGTLVSCTDGDKRIEDIQPGDEVYCYNNNLEIVTETVTNKWKTGYKECVEVTCVDDETGETVTLTCTPEHPIRTISGEYVHAEDLHVGDSLLYR